MGWLYNLFPSGPCCCTIFYIATDFEPINGSNPTIQKAFNQYRLPSFQQLQQQTSISYSQPTILQLDQLHVHNSIGQSSLSQELPSQQSFSSSASNSLKRLCRCTTNAAQQNPL